MCGIVGMIGSSWWSRVDLHESVNEMAATMSHRGPDGHGAWVDSEAPVALGHRRLSIQDLSPTGHQPMISPSGRYCMSYNGEVYNFKHLTKELSKLGHSFRGTSDTEAVLTAFEEWGIESTLQRCQGMFAMGIWDRQTQEVVLCRDRMGEKPLFYGWLDGCFVFASELKPIQVAFAKNLNIDANALAAYFRFGYVPSPHCIYERLYKLIPGTCFRIPLESYNSISEFNPLADRSNFSPHAYWRLDSLVRNGKKNRISDEYEALDEFDMLLRDAVKLQKVADVTVGSFLSGGIDSSLITAIMQAISSDPVKTFTIGFKEQEFDEAPYARAIAQHLGTNHHEYLISANDGLELISDIPKYWDEPFADSSQIPSLLVAREARKDVSVCLTGDGGDELFCGYNRYFANARLWTMQKRVPYVLRKMIGSGVSRVPTQTWQGVYDLFKWLSGDDITQANFGLKMHKLGNLMRMRNIQEAYPYLMSYWQDPFHVIRHSQEADSILDREPNPGLESFIENAMFWDQLGYLVDDNLVKGDRASMAVSLENRLPFLDHRIVEFSWRLPLDMKYRRGQSKWLLRQALYRYVPKELIERPKMGFSVPIKEWLKGPLKTWVNDLIASSSCGVKYLNKSIIQHAWKQHLSGSHDHSQKIWTVCMWLAWNNH